MVGGDLLRLMAMGLERMLGEEAALEFMIHAAGNREKNIHDFMG